MSQFDDLPGNLPDYVPDYVPNYGACSFTELVDIFIQIDDIKFQARARDVLANISVKLAIALEDIEMEHLIANPTGSFTGERYFDREYSLDQSYTRDALEVREKLMRLKPPVIVDK